MHIFKTFSKPKAAILILFGLGAASVTALPAHALTCNVRKAGATGDGHTKDTQAIQKTIDQCTEAGGTVQFTPGTYVSAPLTLKSHTHLSIEKAATLLGSPDMADYPSRADAPWRRMSLLHADNAEDVSITGAGTIDGNGKVWWDAMLNRPKGSHENQRPLLIDLTHTKQILIEGVTIQNSPQYNITTFWCDGLTVRNVRILNPGRGAPNTDGIDPVSTSHVLIEHDYIDTGDDNVAIKSGLVERGDPNIPSTDITIRDCTFKAGHGLSIGSETSGGVRNVTVERVSFTGTRQGIRIKSARGRGNDIGNFTYRDIQMEDVETPIQITSYYTGIVKDDPGQAVTEHTPKFHDITIENLKATGAKYAAVIMGLPESPIHHVVLTDVSISATNGMLVQHADVVEKNAVVKAATGPAVQSGPGAAIKQD